MEKVIVLPEVVDQLDDLIAILYNNDYFNYLENASTYVSRIYQFIDRLPEQRAKKTKNALKGNWYARYQPNKNTTWYILFDFEENIYLVKSILNNHTEAYTSFIL